MTPFLLVLSAPSGGGKTTIARALLLARDDLGYSVSATTRAPRDGERDGVDYHFLSREEFLRRREGGDFVEWAEYGGALYGTLEEEIERVLGSGHHAILDIEVQGARQVRQRRSDVVSIFILPPSAETLVKRLEGRGTGGPRQLVTRLRQALRELDDVACYDYVVVNEDKTQAVAEVAAIIDAESRRSHRIAGLAEEVARLRSSLAEIVGRSEST